MEKAHHLHRPAPPVPAGHLLQLDGVVTARISREEFYAMQSERFVEETFRGSLPSFLAAFTRRRSLSAAEIEEIRRLIDSCEEV